MKRLRWLSIPLTLALVAAIVVSQFQFKTHFTGLISIANAQIIEKLPPSLDIRFEPSGTHVDEQGNLKIRLDFYPKEGDKSYDQQHVFVVDETSQEFKDGYKGEVDKDGQPLDEKDYQAWTDGLPHIWRVNPSLCHFVTVPKEITLAQLDAWVKDTFYADVTATIDDAASQVNSAHLLSPYMVTKASMTTAKVAPTEDKTALVDTINTRLAAYSVSASGTGTSEPIQPQSIDVGPEAINRTNSRDVYHNTILSLYNPANGTGTLDTVEIWMAYANAGSSTYVGTISLSGDTGTCRDSADLGTITAYSKQTFTGLTISVATGDYIAVKSKSGANCAIEGTNGSGGVTRRYYGDCIDPSDSATFEADYASEISLYATGTEAATFAITNAPGTTVTLGTLAVSSTYYAFGSAPSDPVADNETTQTLTETGGSACDIDIHGHNSTGGAGMSITSDAPGVNEFRIKAYYAGSSPTNGVVITTSDQELYDNLAASGHFHWDFSFESASSFTVPEQQTTTLTVTARAHS